MTIFPSCVRQSVIFFSFFNLRVSKARVARRTVCKVLVDVYLFVGVSVVVILQ